MNNQPTEIHPDDADDDGRLPTRATLELVSERANAYHAATINLVVAAGKGEAAKLTEGELLHIQGTLTLLDESLSLLYAEASGGSLGRLAE